MIEKEAEVMKRKLLDLEELMLRHMWTPMMLAPDDKLAEEPKGKERNARKRQIDQ